MAAAWHGGAKNGDAYVDNAPLLAAIKNGMDWWFARDFTNPACLDSGGGSSCTCDDTTLWNTNWFSNVIIISTHKVFILIFYRSV